MSKRKHSNIKGRLQVFFEMSKLSIPAIVGGAGTLISAIGAVVSKAEDKLIFLGFALLSLIVVIVTLIIKLREYHLDLKGMHYLDDPGYVTKMEQKITESTDLTIIKSNRFESTDYMVAVDDAVNEYLFKNAKEIAIVVDGKYRLPKEYRDILRFSLDKKLTSGHRFFDAPKYRLYSSINVGTKQIKLEKTRYFYSFATNENAFKRIRSYRSLAFKFDGGNALFDDDGRLLSNEMSYQSNHLGASTLAFTKDGYVIIGKQNNENNVNGGRNVPSGSGSINLCDFRGNLEDMAAANMNRELREECGISKKVKIDTKLIAYGRFVNRGFKPDFFGISFVYATKEELERNRGDGELVNKAFVKVDNVEHLLEIIHKYDAAASIQLAAYSHFLEAGYIKDYVSSMLPR